MVLIGLYLLLAASLFLFPDIRYQAGLSLLVTAGLIAVPFRKTRAGLLPICILLVFTFLGNVFFHPGKILLGSGLFSVTDEGLRHAGIRVLRLYSMIYGAKILTSLIPLEEMVAAIGNLLSPLERLGVPVAEFFAVMALTVQAFPPLTKRFIEAYRGRNNEADAAGLRQRINGLAAFMGPFFVESIRSPEKFFTGGTAGR